MTAVPSLDGVEAKIRRANFHLANLEAVLLEVLDPKLHYFAFDDKREDGYDVYRVYGVPDIDPDWSLIVGDCIHNLRSALDHLAWQLVIIDGQDPTDKTQFPIRDLPFNPKNGIVTPTQLKPPIRDVDILKALEEAQPYFGEQGRLLDPRDHPLWAVGHLDIVDKHRLLLVVSCVFDIKNLWWGVDAPEVGPDIRRINLAPLKNGDPVAWFDFHGAARPENFKPNAILQIAIREKATNSMLGLLSAPNALGLLRWVVEDEIVNWKFRRFFP